MQKVYFKNNFIDESEAKISIADRSFRFGDGIFETLLVHKGKIFDYQSHHTRIINGLKDFFIEIDLSKLESLCEELIRVNKLNTAYIRIIISRGENGPGSIGYLPKNSKPYLIIQSFETKLPEFKTLKLSLSSYRAYKKLNSKINVAPQIMF